MDNYNVICKNLTYDKRIIKNMIEEKIDINTISKITGMSKEEIQKLKLEK